jgi:hypothetical protein
MIIIKQLWSLPNRALTLSTHISNFEDIGQCWIFTPHFYAVFWQPFWKWETSWKFWKGRIAPLLVTYHYIKMYVSIIIQLEVININVRNFKFPIGFYSNHHPLWTPKNMTLTPFTTELKTLGSYIYNSTKFHEIVL